MKEEAIKYKLISVLIAIVISCFYFKYNAHVIEFTVPTLPVFPKHKVQIGRCELHNSAAVDENTSNLSC